MSKLGESFDQASVGGEINMHGSARHTGIMHLNGGTPKPDKIRYVPKPKEILFENVQVPQRATTQTRAPST